MENIAAALEILFAATGVRARVEPDGAKPTDDTQRTYFTVSSGGEHVLFSIDGTGEGARITAALAREYLTGAMGKSAVDPVRAFLCGGELPPGVRVGKADHYVFAIYGAARHRQALEYIAAMATVKDMYADMGDGVTAFCKLVDSDCDYQSAGELAAVLRENMTEEIDADIKIGVGGVAHGVSELPLYYSYARSALVSGAEFDPKNSVYSHKEYALVRILSELPQSETEKYIKTVLDKNYREVLADEELMTAADAFIKHSLNISEASRSMYVHRNTLIYRLDKIERVTGLNIRNFNDAMTFRIAYMISKLI